MTTIYYDAPYSDDTRREELFRGNLFVQSPSPGAEALVVHARSMIEEAFGDLDPRTAQDHMPVEDYAALLAELKPKFIHHPRSKECIQEMLVDFGADPRRTYFDVPRMRTSTSGGYLTSGIAYAFHAHRDTWYSAPMCQLNWWMPIYEVESDNVMAFHPRYWDEAVPNSSEEYDYYDWNETSRREAAKHVTSDTRKQPRATVPIDPDPQLRIIARPGAPMIFSAAQLHSSVENTTGRTRFSIDFRTVHLDDVVARRGAPNLDSACTGTTMGDYLQVGDLSHIPEDIIAAYDQETSRERRGLVAQS
ncbi:hypothetical protein [Geodermatophilus arenarius]|uniref:Phytanoyl-CoA dioxygenase family protein n=1 Tax=Geodermatophilus arenarius TaxID=1137990 RepID=A0ABV9LJC8_9ACTN